MRGPENPMSEHKLTTAAELAVALSVSVDASQRFPDSRAASPSHPIVMR